MASTTWCSKRICFHEALEEKSIVAALVTARPYLATSSLATQTGLAPGQGFLPWRDIVEVLRALKYDAWISMEFTQKPDSPTCAKQVDGVHPAAADLVREQGRLDKGAGAIGATLDTLAMSYIGGGNPTLYLFV